MLLVGLSLCCWHEPFFFNLAGVYIPGLEHT